jgi:hypothetical protein
MRILSAGRTVRIDKWQTKKELAYRLAGCDGGSIMLGDDAEDAREFFSLLFYREAPDAESGTTWGVGVCSEALGLGPYLLLRPGAHVSFLGFNSQVVGLATNRREARFAINLWSPFATFACLDEQGITLVFHEIGVVALTGDGEELWRYSKDVVVGTRIGQDFLELKFMDALSVRLNVKTGEVK